jgi:hypothetical protein
MNIGEITEAVILAEMEVAGEEALKEARRARLTDAETAVAIYLAMRAVYAVQLLAHSETVH